MLGNDGGNQYKIAHNNGRKRARETISSMDSGVNRDLYFCTTKPDEFLGLKSCYKYKLSMVRFSLHET